MADAAVLYRPCTDLPDRPRSRGGERHLDPAEFRTYGPRHRWRGRRSRDLCLGNRC
jgi:hypothetical protein